MAEADFIPVRAIPVLTIPDIGVEEHDLSLMFRIATTAGVIDVEGRHDKWHCTGRADALSAAGLIDVDWLPGNHGNNKVSQTVIFCDGVAAPYRGNPKGRSLGNYIRIMRAPGHRFEVEIPATPVQTERLKALVDRYYVQLRDGREQKQRDEAIKAEARNKTPADVRDYIHGLLGGLSGLADAYATHAGFRLDPASQRIFDQHIAILHDVVQKAVIARVPGEFTGNVVPFGSARRK
jgi:hypothetical protein